MIVARWSHRVSRDFVNISSDNGLPSNWHQAITQPMLTYYHKDYYEHTSLKFWYWNKDIIFQENAFQNCDDFI